MGQERLILTVRAMSALLLTATELTHTCNHRGSL